MAKVPMPGSPQGEPRRRLRRILSAAETPPVAPPALRLADDPEQVRIDAVVAAYHRMVMERLDEGLRALQGSASRLMNDIASEVWQTVGPEAGQALGERVISAIAKDDTVRSLMAHADERYQAIDLRIRRLETGVSQVGAQTRDVPTVAWLGSVLADMRTGLEELDRALASNRGAGDGAGRIEAVVGELHEHLSRSLETLSARLGSIDRQLSGPEDSGGDEPADLRSDLARLGQGMRVLADALRKAHYATVAEVDSLRGTVTDAIGEVYRAADEGLTKVDERIDAAERRSQERDGELKRRLAAASRWLDARVGSTADRVASGVAEHAVRLEQRLVGIADGVRALPHHDRLDTALAGMTDRLDQLDRALDRALDRDVLPLGPTPGEVARQTERFVAAKLEETERDLTIRLVEAEQGLTIRLVEAEQGLAARVEQVEAGIGARLELIPAAVSEWVKQTGHGIEARIESMAQSLARAVAEDAEAVASLERRLGEARAAEAQAVPDLVADVAEEIAEALSQELTGALSRQLAEELRRTQSDVRRGLGTISDEVQASALAVREDLLDVSTKLERLKKDLATSPFGLGPGTIPDTIEGIDTAFFGTRG